MQILNALLWADSLAAKSWFSTKTTSRMLVGMLFLLVFGGIAVGLYFISFLFFNYLASFARFGDFTAAYLIHAALVLLLWLAIHSCAVTATSFILSANPSLTLLLSLPIPPRWIATWMFLKTIATNMALIVFALMPIAFAYANAFDLPLFTFSFQTLLVLACLVTVSASVGIVIALSIVKWLRGREYLGALLGLFVFFFGLVALVKLIFPPQISLLNRTRASEFETMYASLPLNYSFIPTKWLAHTITENLGIETVLAVLGTLAIGGISLQLQTRHYIPVIVSERSRSNTQHIARKWKAWLLHARQPLIIKDWLSIVRMPGEIGYGVFLFSIALFFFLFLAAGTNHPYIQREQEQLVSFSLGWLLFFTIALLLRFIFPLMAREGKSAWYLFSLPLARKMILQRKIWFALSISVSLGVLTAIVWSVLPFGSPYRDFTLALSLMTIFFLTWWQVLLGAITPSFSLSDEPEKVSTSGMGLLALGLSVGMAAISVFLSHQVMALRLDVESALLCAMVIGTFITSVLWFLANQAVRRYQW